MAKQSKKNKGGREGVGRGGTEFCWLKDQRNGPRFLQLLRVWSPVCGVVASGVTPVCGEAVSGVTGVVVSHVTPVSYAAVSGVAPCFWRGCIRCNPLFVARLLLSGVSPDPGVAVFDVALDRGVVVSGVAPCFWRGCF